MEQKKIGIVILATNAYFVLGVRFIKKFMHHYHGESRIKFYFFSDEDPTNYLSNNVEFAYFNQSHTNWVTATNSKFKNVVDIKEQLRSEVDYVYYFDADTGVSRSFTEEWFLGDLVGGEHYGNRSFLANGQGFDRNPIGHSYVPLDSPLPYTYHYGAFFGGTTDNIINFCETLTQYQIEDQAKDYEPPVNDESYINAYFHFNPPTYSVPCEKFAFDISHKGGIGETRNTRLDVSHLKEEMLSYKDSVYDVIDGKITNVKAIEIKNLVDLFNFKGYSYYQTDKNTTHSYLETYEKLFQSYKDEDIVFLEVGVREGGSLRLWGDYFSKAIIYGYDIVDSATPNTFNERINYIVKDINTVTPDEVADMKIKIALDDGSHMLQDQVEFVKKFYPNILEGGMVIVEDIQNVDSDRKHFEELGYPFEIIDLRGVKNRYDDVIFLFRK